MFSSTTVLMAGRFDFSNAFALPNAVRKSKSGSHVQAQGFRRIIFASVASRLKASIGFCRLHMVTASFE
jgi:hypothetical protein